MWYTSRSMAARLIGPVACSTIAGGIAFLTTAATVKWFGLSVFASFMVDLARLALVLSVTELVPSAYAVQRIQRDREFEADFRLLNNATALLAAVGAYGMALMGWFNGPPIPIACYVGATCFQRRLDVQMQAHGRVGRFLIVPIAANVGRLSSLVVLVSVRPDLAGLGVVWSAAALGSVFGQLVGRAGTMKGDCEPELKTTWSAFSRLAKELPLYVKYYPTIVLKRVRDSFIGLVCGTGWVDEVAAGRYFVASRSLDFVLGQMRVIEVLAVRAEMRMRIRNRRRINVVSMLAVGVALVFGLGWYLLWEAGAYEEALPLLVVCSLVVVPYTSELLQRSSAYAAFEPSLVSASFAIQIACAALVLAVAGVLGAISAVSIALAQLSAQSCGAIAYRWCRRSLRREAVG